jgi:hypothetical protein
VVTPRVWAAQAAAGERSWGAASAELQSAKDAEQQPGRHRHSGDFQRHPHSLTNSGM